MPGDAERAVLIQTYKILFIRGDFIAIFKYQVPSEQVERKQRNFSWKSTLRGHRHILQEQKGQFNWFHWRLSINGTSAQNGCGISIRGNTQAQLHVVLSNPNESGFVL